MIVKDCKITGFKKLQHFWITSAFNEHKHVHVMCTWKIDRNVVLILMREIIIVKTNFPIYMYLHNQVVSRRSLFSFCSVN